MLIVANQTPKPEFLTIYNALCRTIVYFLIYSVYGLIQDLTISGF
jgi:hypothetical protein